VIIVITNRKLPVIPTNQAESIAVPSLGEDLAQRTAAEDIIYSGLLNDADNTILFQPKGSESALFDNISEAELAKPWVFFVHGFNQDPQSNIDKARALSNNHHVNVIAFAWPSHPLDFAMDWDDARQVVIKGLLNGLSGSAIIGKLLMQKAKSYLKDKWKNYPPAIKNAENSNVDILAALTLIDTHLNCINPPVLLIHSMGNYLLQNTMKSTRSLPMSFSNIILHQADATSPGYDWVQQLNANLTVTAKLYITINAADFVLGASTMRRTILRKEHVERIGQVRMNHLPGDIHYLDFTDGEWVDNEHEFFQLSKYDTNDFVFDVLDRILKGESDKLPTENNQSNVGFSKMPTNVSLCCLEDIIHPADADEVEDDILPVKSLDLFNQQLAEVNRDYSEEEA